MSQMLCDFVRTNLFQIHEFVLEKTCFQRGVIKFLRPQLDPRPKLTPTNSGNSEMHCGKIQVGSTSNLCPRFNPGSPESNSGRGSNSGPDKVFKNSSFVKKIVVHQKIKVV